MHKKLLLFLTICSLFKITDAQEVKKIRIIDSLTKEKVPFATIYIKSKSLFFDADSLGQIDYSLSLADTTVITCVGYYDKYIFGLKDLTPEILLVRKPKVLTQVYIGRFPTKQVGIFESKVAFSKTPNLPDRTEYATLIRIPNKIAKYSIQRLYFKIRPEKKTSNFFNPIRINLYKVSKNGEPGEQLLQNDIALTSFTLTNDLMTIDLSEQNLILEEDAFFVGLQWIRQQGDVTNYKQPQISFTEKGAEQVTWRRTYQFNNYNWFLPATLTFWGNMMVKADLKVFEE